MALIEAGKRGTWPGGSRWTRPFLRLDRDNTLLSDRAERVEQNLSDLDYWRKLEDEVPDTVEFMEDHGVKLIHHDEENAALDFEEQHFAHPTGGGKEIADNYLILIAKYETADVFYGHEATELILDDEGWIGGVVVREPDGGQRHITAGTAGQFEMFHAELVDPRAKTPHSVIWGQNYGIVVNENGERFHDEGEDYLFATTESIAYDTWRHQNQKSYFITDRTVMDRFEGTWVYETAALPPEQSDTIGGLAEKLGLDPAKLEATVSEFNAACGPGDWDPTRMDGKETSGITPPKSNWANPIAEAPFSGFPMTAQVKFTFGGLKVDTDGRVLNTNEEPIPGLYAAGEITGLYHKHPPATSVLRANTFGRIVGMKVAESLSAAPTG